MSVIVTCALLCSLIVTSILSIGIRCYDPQSDAEHSSCDELRNDSALVMIIIGGILTGVMISLAIVVVVWGIMSCHEWGDE